MKQWNCSETRLQTQDPQLGSAIVFAECHLHLLRERQLSPCNYGLAALEMIKLHFPWYYFREADSGCGVGLLGVQVLALCLTSCVNLGQLTNAHWLNLSPHWWNGNNKSLYLRGLLWELSELVHVKCFVQDPAHSIQECQLLSFKMNEGL